MEDQVVDVQVRISKELSDRVNRIMERERQRTGLRLKVGPYIESALAAAVARDEDVLTEIPDGA